MAARRRRGKRGRGGDGGRDDAPPPQKEPADQIRAIEDIEKWPFSKQLADPLGRLYLDAANSLVPPPPTEKPENRVKWTADQRRLVKLPDAVLVKFFADWIGKFLVQSGKRRVDPPHLLEILSLVSPEGLFALYLALHEAKKAWEQDVRTAREEPKAPRHRPSMGRGARLLALVRALVKDPRVDSDSPLKGNEERLVAEWAARTLRETHGRHVATVDSILHEIERARRDEEKKAQRTEQPKRR